MTKESGVKRRTISWDKDHMWEVARTLKAAPSKSQMCIPDTISSPAIERVNERELTSIYALLAYVAYNQNIRQETVQMIVEAEFGVDHVAKIKRDDYMRAIEFLVDLKLDEVIN